jgi:hypothetical protein
VQQVHKDFSMSCCDMATKHNQDGGNWQDERQVEHASVSWWDIEVGAVTVFLDPA